MAMHLPASIGVYNADRAIGLRKPIRTAGHAQDKPVRKITIFTGKARPSPSEFETLIILGIAITGGIRLRVHVLVKSRHPNLGQQGGLKGLSLGGTTKKKKTRDHGLLRF
jgi:hypothetical protein